MLNHVPLLINHFSEEYYISAFVGYLRTSINLHIEPLRINLEAHLREIYFQNSFLSMFVDLNKK